MTTSFRRDTHSVSCMSPIRKAIGAMFGMAGLCFMSTLFLGIATTDSAVAFGVCVKFCDDYTPPSTTYRRRSSGTWGCYARASNGASGSSWSWSSEAGARGRALAECRKVSRGRACTIRYCQRGTSAASRPGPPRTAPPPRITPDGQIVDTGNWGCYAQARNGRGGYSWGFGNESAARQRALAECRSSSGQSSCTVRACQPGTSAQLRPSKRPVTRAAQRPKRYAYSCSLCVRKLEADLRSGWASGRSDSYIRQARAGFENCKRKASGTCSAGSVLTKYRRLERERTARAARVDLERQDRAATERRLAAAIERGDYKTAVVVQAGVVEANKDDPGSWGKLATYLEKSGQLDKAATAIRRAALLSKKDAAPLVSAMYRREAAARAASGDLRLAIAQQAMAVEASNKDPGLWHELAGYLEKDGQIDHAATAYRRAHLLGAPNPDARIFAMYQADVMARSGSAGDAEKIELYRSLIEKFPGARANTTRRRLAEVLLRQDRTSEAREVLQQIARLDPGDDAARSKLASIQDPDRSQNGPHAPFEQSHGEKNRIQPTSGNASAAGYGQKGGPQAGNKVSQPGKDVQAATYHGNQAVAALPKDADVSTGADMTGALAKAKDQTMMVFDTAGKRITEPPHVAKVYGRDTGAATPELIPKDIGADVPAAKRQQVIAALGKNPDWARLADKRRKIESKRAEIDKRREELVASYKSANVRADPQKRAAIEAKIAKTVIEDDKVRDELHAVRLEQQKIVKKVVETVSFSVQIVDEKKPDDTEKTRASDPIVAKPAPAQKAGQ